MTLKNFYNKSFVYDVKGLENYGTINGSNLFPSITDTTWTAKDGGGIYDSVQKLFTRLVKQARGLIDRLKAITLILSHEMDE